VAFASIDDLDSALAQASYLADRGLATALYLALKLEKPLLLEGEAGVGKTEAAKATAVAVGAPLIRLQCYEGLDIAHAVYEWNYARQLLHIRAAQAGTVDEAEFHDWYDLEHVPERLRIPGVLNAERWIDVKNPKVSVATYDIETVGVLQSAPYAAIAGANSSPWRRAIIEPAGAWSMSRLPNGASRAALAR